MVVAQSTARLLPIPEDQSSNLVIGNPLLNNYLLFVDKTKIKKKIPGIAHFKTINRYCVGGPVIMMTSNCDYLCLIKAIDN